MKREVTSPKGATIKAPEPPKTEIRQFGNAIEYMVDQMAQRWRTQIFKELNKDTIAKFSDAKQSGNFAKVFLTMAHAISQAMAMPEAHTLFEPESHTALSRGKGKKRKQWEKQK